MVQPTSTLETFEAAVAGATNDECVEMTLRLFKEVGHRCDRLAEMVLEVDDRDAVNEAFTFVSAAEDIVPSLRWSEPRIDKPHRRIYDAKTRLDKAIKRRGRTGPIPWDEKTPEDRRQQLEAAERAREREQAAGNRLLAKTDLSPARVLMVLRGSGSPDALMRARDVAVLLVPKAKDTQLVGRQRLINRVGMVLKQLAEAGELERLMPDDPKDGRATSRFKLRPAS